MKKPPFLEITENELHWVGPSFRARIELLKRDILKVLNKIHSLLKLIWKYTKIIGNIMALPILILVLFAILWPWKYPEEKPKIPHQTLVEQLDYYQEKAQEFKNAKK